MKYDLEKGFHRDKLLILIDSKGGLI